MNAKLKAFLLNFWNEPRRFCIALVLLSTTAAIAGYLAEVFVLYAQTLPSWVHTLAVAGIVCLAAGFLAGWLGFFLSLIPPLYRLEARLLKRRFFLLACLATLVALFYTVENWRGKSAWNRFQREWEAKGERFDRASLIPAPVPDAENFAAAPIVMTSYSELFGLDGRRKEPRDTNVINRMRMPTEAERVNVDSPRTKSGNWQKAERTDLAAWQAYYRKVAEQTNLFPVPAQAQSPAADVLLALGKYDSALEELRQATRRPRSRYPLDYDAEDTMAILLPHLAPLKGCAQTLRLRACAELELGQTDAAFEDVRLMLRLAGAVHDEPMLISHLVRISILHLALQPVWEGLAEHRWSDRQLAALDEELKPLDFLADYRLSMRSEMILCQIAISEYLRKHPEQLSNFGDDNFSLNETIAALSPLMPGGWIDQNQLRCCRLMLECYLPLADLEHRTFNPTRVQEGDQTLRAELAHPTPMNFLVRLLMPALSNASKRFGLAQANTDLARTACALERYRLARGDYPEALDALAPAFLEKLPHDAIGGQPLKYRPPSPGSGAAGRFVLYSVGWNESDDGGTVATKKRNDARDEWPMVADPANGDWVWTQP